MTYFYQGTNRVPGTKHEVLRLKGGAGEEESSSGDENESTDEPPRKKSRTVESTFFEADLSDELMRSPTLPAKPGVKVKRRSGSCDGRLQGCTFFHSTPLRPGPGLNVTFKDDMDLIHSKIIDMKKKNKRRRTMGVQQRKYEEVKGGHDGTKRVDVSVHNNVVVQGGDGSVQGGNVKDTGAHGGGVKDGNVDVSNANEKAHDDVTNDGVRVADEKVKHAGVSVHKDTKAHGGDGGVKDGHDGVKHVDVSVHNEVVVQGGDGSVQDDNVKDTGVHSGDGGVKDGNINAPSDDEACDVICEGDPYLDPYDFNDDCGLDDSMEDPTFELPKEKRTKTFDTVKMWSRIQKGQSSKKPPAVTDQYSKRTPPAEFRKRRDAADEAHWRQLGGSTPDERQKKKRPGLNLKVLEFLVHKEAKAKGIDLARVALKLAFFNDLVRLYGDVEGANRLTPWTSGRYIMKKWRLLFCTKTTSKQGTRWGDVHIYEPPQFDETPCNLCNTQQTPDVRDTMLDHFMKASSTRNAKVPIDVNELVKCPHCEKGFKTPKTLKNHITVKHPEQKPMKPLVDTQKGVRSTCPHCNSSVADLGRHVREDCRMRPENLVECPHCFAKIPRLRLKEHVNGRVNKVTGVVTKKGCIDKQKERVTSDGKEKNVAPKTRCDECGKNVTQKYLPEHKRLFHKESKLPERKDGPGPETASIALESLPSKTGQSCLSSREKQPETDKLNGGQKQAKIFYTREQWVHAVNEANYKIAQENSKKDAHLNQADMSRRGIQYLEQFGIRAITPCRTSTGEPRFSPPDGDCLFSTAVILQNPDLSDDETKESATSLRISTVGEALHLFPNLSVETKEQLRQACSGLASPDAEPDIPLTDEQVEALLATYMQSGEYEDNMGDVLCYLLASRLRATLLVINVARMTAYFVEPNIFNHERSSKEIYVLVHGGEHYEGLKLSRESQAQLEELHQTTFLNFEGHSTETNKDKGTSKSQAACKESSTFSRVEDVPKPQAVSGIFWTDC